MSNILSYIVLVSSVLASYARYDKLKQHNYREFKMLDSNKELGIFRIEYKVACQKADLLMSK